MKDPLATVVRDCLAQLAAGRERDGREARDAVLAALRRPGLAPGQARRVLQAVLGRHFDALGREGISVLPGRPDTGLGPGAWTLLASFLSTWTVADEELEWSCTELREALLHAQAASVAPWQFELACAMAVQCFRNEHVFAEGRGEGLRVDGLARSIEDRLASGEFPAPLDIARLGMYRPCTRLRGIEAVAVPAPDEDYAAMWRALVDAPLAEARIAAELPALTPIEDEVSRAVRAQYEENPYPRWHRAVVGAAAPATAPGHRHLVAGCGSGRQAIEAALASPAMRITAVDLSRASLAYAVRMAGELGVRNVDFAQADLLRLPGTGLRFDSISSVGVIHHMQDPAAGLRALRDLMAGERGLKVAVYTESGRRGIVAAIRLREAHGFPPTAEGIRAFRQAVAALPEDDPARDVVRYEDFYTVSGCRDLVFHVMEHRFTIPRFAAMAAACGLRIESIEASPAVQAAFAGRFPAPGAAADLAAWDRFEEASPGAFGAMYRFRLARA